MRFRLLIPLLPIWPSIILAQQEAFYLLFIFNIIAVEKYETPIFYCLMQHTAVFKHTVSLYGMKILQTGKYFPTIYVAADELKIEVCDQMVC
jgi:hypothetical protein